MKAPDLTKTDGMQLSKAELLDLVTQQNELIKNLSKSEKKYQNLFNQSIDGIYKSTPDGKFTEVNAALVKMLGYDSKNELLEIDIATQLYISPKERITHLKNSVDNNVQTIRFLKKDGAVIYVEDYGRHITNKKGKVLYYEGIIRDVTEREKSQLTIKTLLKIAEQGYKIHDLKEFNKFIMVELGKLIDTTNFYIAFFNEDKQTIQIPFISGEDSEEEFPIGKSMTGYLIKNKKPVLIKYTEFNKLIDKGKVELIGTFPKVWMGAPLKINNKIIGAIVVQSYTDENAYKPEDIELLENISSHISLAVQRKKMENDMAFSRQLLRKVLDNIPTKVFWKDKDSKFLGVNAASLKEMNIKDENEIIGKSDFDFHELKYAQKYRNDELEIMTSGKAKLNYVETQNKNGAERWYVSSKLPFFDDQNNVIGIIGTSDDITETVENERKLKAASETAIAANLSKSVFLSNMSHEIRTPMNAILGYSQLLQEGTNLTDEQQENLKTINKSGTHLLTLINDILDMSKIEAGRVNLNNTNFNFKELIVEVEQLFRIKAQQKNLLMQFNLSSKVPDNIVADEAKIRQILINLVGNSIKFTSKGFVNIFVNKLKENTIQITVEDSGKGILKEDLELIFRPFEQAKKDGTVFGGTGLGLAISKKFANLMNGNITVSSVFEKGSEFSFTFQYEEGETENKVEDHKHNRIIELSDNMKGTKIAVVDDRFENRDILFKKLSSLGFDIKLAENGKEAVELFKTWKPKIILMDVVMPVMNGVEATKKILALDTNNQTKIFIVSASALESEQIEVMKIGATSFIKKPVIFSELLNELELKGGIKFKYESNVLQKQQSNNIKPSEIPVAIKSKILEAAREGDFLLLQELLDELKLKTDKSYILLENFINELNFDSLVDWLNTKD